MHSLKGWRNTKIQRASELGTPLLLGATLLKLSLQSRPGDAFVTVLIERSKAAVKLHPLCGCQGKLIVF